MVGKRHPLHSLCSYLGCFPPRVPQRLIQQLVRPGQIVLDPFCGSGTTLVEAALAGHSAVGLDLNPLAAAIARAKIQQVSADGVLDRLHALARGYPGVADTEHVPDGLKIIYHPRTLAQLVYLRGQLDVARPEDAFILGATLGLMHGKFKKGGSESAYLSIDMPNTFSMSAEYVRKFVKKHNLKQLPIDAFGRLRDRVDWLLREGALPGRPWLRVAQGDATQLPRELAKVGLGEVGAIVTSPPYLGVLRYGAFNWIRLWLLGHEPAAVDRRLDGTDSLDRYLSFIASFLLSAAEVLPTGAPLALVIGDVVEFGSHLDLASRVWDEVSGVVPFELRTISVDDFDETTKTTRIWGEEKKGRATPQDRILVLSKLRVRSRPARPAKAPRRVSSGRRSIEARSRTSPRSGGR